MDLRPIERSDIPALMDFMVAMREEAPALAQVPVDRQYTGLNLDHMLDAGMLFGTIAPGRGCVLGLLSPNWYDVRVKAYEQMLYVIPALRGKLLAARLVSSFIKAAQDRNATEICVGSSTGIDDERTARLWTRFGFVNAGLSLRMSCDV